MGKNERKSLERQNDEQETIKTTRQGINAPCMHGLWVITNVKRPTNTWTESVDKMSTSNKRRGRQKGQGANNIESWQIAEGSQSQAH